MTLSETIELIEKAIEHATPGVWDIWEERTPTKADAIAEMAYQVENTEPFSGAVFLLNADGKCPAATGCGPTSAANAAYIAACSPDRMREVLAAAREAEALKREIAELRDSLSDVLELAERQWANPEELSEIRRARALLSKESADDQE